VRGLDFSSWQNLLLTFIGIAVFTLISMGIRLLMMLTLQQRRERMNRQINERLKTLIGAYKVLGGSFTGTLTVDPTHLRDLRKPVESGSTGPAPQEAESAGGDLPRSDRSRRIRDTVEAALSDIILLGTEEQVRLAEQAARELVAGRPVHTGVLVVSLRNFIREALDLAPVPNDLQIPQQGPARPSGSGGRNRGENASGRSGGGGGMGMGMGGGGIAIGPGTIETDSPASDSSSESV
jgi:hypothetical protein